MGILYLDYEIPFSEFRSKTRNQKMDFNAKKSVLKVESNQEFHFHFIFHFYPCYWEIRKKRFAGAGDSDRCSFLRTVFKSFSSIPPKEKRGKMEIQRGISRR